MTSPSGHRCTYCSCSVPVCRYRTGTDNLNASIYNGAVSANDVSLVLIRLHIYFTLGAFPDKYKIMLWLGRISGLIGGYVLRRYGFFRLQRTYVLHGTWNMSKWLPTLNMTASRFHEKHVGTYDNVILESCWNSCDSINNDIAQIRKSKENGHCEQWERVPWKAASSDQI